MRSDPVIFYSSPARASRSVMPAPAPVPRPAKKSFVRRRGDVSQQIRLAVQIVFAAITLMVGVQFMLWVRYFESGGRTLRVSRPDGVEAWLPIASLMNFKSFILTREVPEAHAAGIVL